MIVYVCLPCNIKKIGRFTVSHEYFSGPINKVKAIFKGYLEAWWAFTESEENRNHYIQCSISHREKYKINTEQQGKKRIF